MPQARKYQLEKVLEHALPLAIERGYRGCPMAVLIAQTGFNRRAFYLHFKNKEEFFEALLNHYLQAHLLPLNQHLSASNDAQSCIVRYFTEYQQLIHSRGCLLTKLIVEMGSANTAIQHEARWFYDQLQLEFIALLERAQQHKQITRHINIEKQALRLTCLAQGFAVSSHIIQGKDDVSPLIQSIFDLSS
jgi:AcrR family transcriptional regulator